MGNRSVLRLRSRAAAALLGASLLAAATAVAPPVAIAQEAGSEAFGFDLAGDWLLMTGDDMAWADPSYDDSDWTTVQAPSDDQQGVFADYDGYAWFRKTFDLPADAAGLNLVGAFGFIDDADATYVNGELVGVTGEVDGDDSQWFEQRLYPIPAGLLQPGQSNTIAVRMNDFTGGGGWYRGPIGIFSKQRLRAEVHGVTAPLADTAATDSANTLLAAQAAAIAGGDVDAYLATLGSDFFHDGDDAERRERDLRRWLGAYDRLELRDNEVEVLRDTDGTILVDTNRQLVGITGTDETELRELAQDFLRLDGGATMELGNRSRFFRDGVESALEGFTREFVVYLPPSYATHPDHEFPIIYFFHGINGGAREWEPRDMRDRLDKLMVTEDPDDEIAEAIVVFPDGESLWYIDSSVTPWRSMFLDEMMPLVESEFRTLDTREFRGTSGVSMGGHGAFTIGWANPDLFSSIASHIGALDLPPLVGGPTEIAANSPEAPTTQVQTHTPEFLSSYQYFFDACRDDEFRFGEAVMVMDASLTAKGVPHEAVVYPEGRHDDACWVPHLDSSFGMHTANFRANGLVEPATLGGTPVVTPAPDPTTPATPAPTPTTTTTGQAAGGGTSQLPATGGGAALLGLATLGAGAALSRRRHR